MAIHSRVMETIQTMNINLMVVLEDACTKFHVNPSNSCLGISVWTKVVNFVVTLPSLQPHSKQGFKMKEWGSFSVACLLQAHISAHFCTPHLAAAQRVECCWGSFATPRPGLAEGLGRPCLWQSHCLKLQEISWATAAVGRWYDCCQI